MSREQRKPLALIVDSDSTVCSMSRASLESSGFRVEEAYDGATGIEMTRKLAPDLIILDVELPNIDGLSVCSQIRSFPAFVDTPIVMLTRLRDELSIQIAYDSGATDFIAKPVNWSLLGHRVRYILRASRISRGLRVSEAKNRAFIQAIPDSLLIVDAKGVLKSHHSGQAGSRIIDEQLAKKGSVFDALPEPLADLWRRQIGIVLRTNLTQHGEFQTTVGGEYYHFETRMVPYTKTRVLIILRDVSIQKQADAKIRKLAFFDSLTGLPNRQSFLIQVSEAIRLAEHDETTFSILYIDLDNFKRINDSLGHSLGDALLKSLANRLESCVRSDDYVAHADRNAEKKPVARLGGDEFSVLLNNVDSPDEAESVAIRIVEELGKPIEHEKQQFVITPSIGVATYPDDGRDIDTLIKNADMAMYSAKAEGRNRVSVFSRTMSVRSLERLDLEASLRSAIDKGELELHYQPKLHLESRRITGVEALVRWTDPERGPIPPSKFIQVAEDAGLILDLSHWVLQAACDQLGEWRDTALGETCIAINLSARQFFDRNIIRQVSSALSSRSLDSSRLEFELTENILMQDTEAAMRIMTELREAGITIAIDDFGTGYSSLSNLKTFPIDALKIDRSFVSEISAGGDLGSICSAIVALAKSLGKKVIAEGVESLEQLHHLKFLGCDEVQGFFFAKPMPASEATDYLQQHLGKGRQSELFSQLLEG